MHLVHLCVVSQAGVLAQHGGPHELTGQTSTPVQ